MKPRLNSAGVEGRFTISPVATIFDARHLRAILTVFLFASSISVSPESAIAADFKPIVLDRSYDHDRWGTQVLGSAGTENAVRKFRAFISVFDGADDDNGDGNPDHLGLPHFVAYEMKRYTGELPKGPQRPSSWITDKKLYRLGLAPKDSSYRHSRAFLQSHPNWYVRGHLCMKHHAWRLGANADWNTHTVLNAVPQRQDFNAGIWLDLEKKTAKWADIYGAVWIVAGPIFEPQPLTPREWLGEPEKGEVPIGIPDKLFKVIIRETENPLRPEFLAFIYPQDAKRGAPYDHHQFAVSVDIVEAKTGLDFLSTIPDDIEQDIEKQATKDLWPTN